MTQISFKQNLMQNVGNNSNTSIPTVEQILSQPQETSVQVPKSINYSWYSVTIPTAVALVALGFAGRKGYLSKKVQKLLGGTPSFSKAQIEEKINAKLNEYISRTEDSLFDIKLLGKNKYRAVRMKANGNEEVITFNAKSGKPEFRVEFQKGKGEKSLEYTSYKGADILDADFDEASNVYKQFSRTGIKRKHLFGAKYTDTNIKYGEMVKSEEPLVRNIRTNYYRDNQISSIYEKDAVSNNEILKEFLYNNDGNVIGVDFIKQDSPVIRRIVGEAPVGIDTPSKKSSYVDKILKFFSIDRKNII